jgi:prolyl 4-hydroxylase
MRAMRSKQVLFQEIRLTQTLTPSTATALDAHGADWRNWVENNLKAGCDPAEMRASMVQGGWSDYQAGEALDAAARLLFPDRCSNGRAAIPLPVLPDIGTTQIDGQTITTTVRLLSPAVALCENVLTAQECAGLIAIARERGLVNNTVVDPATGATVIHPERTSAGLMFTPADNPLVIRVENRIAALTQWPAENAEGLQILAYTSGQEYRPHFDAFPPGQAGAAHMTKAGQRVNTVLVYLQAPLQGGATWFPKVSLTVRPKTGDAVLFRNVDAFGVRDDASLHAGVPVESGEKIVLTCWQRERSFR